MPKSATRSMKLRLQFVVGVFFVLAFGGLSYVLYNLCVVNYSFYTAKADSRQLRPEAISASRGAIYDRNMNVIAQSATVWDIVISPRDIVSKINNSDANYDKLVEERRQKISRELSVILDVDQETIYNLTLNSNSAYAIVKKQVEKELADEVRELIAENLWGTEIYLFENTKRFYTNPTTASATIGFTGNDSQGLYGIEYYYDDELSGTDGYITSLKNANGETIPMSFDEKFDPINGNNLVLTLDDTLQRYLNKVLTQVMTQHNPVLGCTGIVMNVNTGEILAMESLPTYDLSNPYSVYDEGTIADIEEEEDDDLRSQAYSSAMRQQWINKAVSYDYEPGSTYKIITAAAALEENTAFMHDEFYCKGYVQVADRIMRCHIGIPGHGVETFTDALVNSCNPAYIEIGANLGGNLFYRYLQSFGIAEKTGVDLPGELQGAYYSAQMLSSSTVSLASSSFGQSTTVTALQMVTAISAAVNGGNLMTPYIVKDILDENNNIVSSTVPEVKRQVISEETSQLVRELMEEVVEQKKGSNAYVQGYRIGGKSGTSQKQKLIFSDDDMVSSYVAVAPIDNPEIAVYIMVDVPTSGEVYGSVIAAPAAATFLADALPYLGHSPSFTSEQMDQQDLTVPTLVGKGALEASSTLTASGFVKPTVLGDGANVVKQVPAPGTKMSRDGVVILYTEHDIEEKMITIPEDIIGMNTLKAEQMLEKLGLNVVVRGENLDHPKSIIISQSIASGKEVGIGTVIEISSVSAEVD